MNKIERLQHITTFLRTQAHRIADQKFNTSISVHSENCKISPFLTCCSCRARQTLTQNLQHKHVMTETILTIKRWGNGMGVRLPQAVAREAQLCAGQQVCLVIEAGRLIV